MKTYKANKKGMLYLMIGYVVMMVGIFFMDKETFFENRYLFVLIIVPSALILWPLLHTYYQIKDGKLIYRSGFIHGEIDINNIKSSEERRVGNKGKDCKQRREKTMNS